MTQIEILENLLEKAVSNLSAKKQMNYSEIITKNIDVLVESINKNKSLISALATSLLKKFCTPEQNKNLHAKSNCRCRKFNRNNRNAYLGVARYFERV